MDEGEEIELTKEDNGEMAMTTGYDFSVFENVEISMEGTHDFKKTDGKWMTANR